MNRENLDLTLSLELFAGANWTVKVSRGEESTDQGQTRCSLHLPAWTLRETPEQKVTTFANPPYFLVNKYIRDYYTPDPAGK